MGMQAASRRPSQKLFTEDRLNLPWFQNSYLHWNDNSHPVGLLCPYWVKMAKIRLFPICFHCQIVRHRRKSRIRFIFFHPDLRHFTHRRIFGPDGLDWQNRPATPKSASSSPPGEPIGRLSTIFLFQSELPLVCANTLLLSISKALFHNDNLAIGLVPETPAIDTTRVLSLAQISHWLSVFAKRPFG